MNLSSATEVRLGIGALLALQLATTVGAVALLGRMSPAVERILTENVVSLRAAEEMLAAMGAATCGGGGADEVERARFAAAYAQASRSVTEPEEEGPLKRIGQSWGAALEGDCAAAAETRRALLELAEANRESMRRADERARRLGMAGAWAAVLLGLVAFGTGAWVMRRLTGRILEPLSELASTLVAFGRGDTLRRCGIGDAPAEFRTIAYELNRVLDSDLALRAAGGSRCDRALVRRLLERISEPVVVLSPARELIAASPSAEALLHGPGESAVHAAIQATLDAPRSGGPKAPCRVEPAGDGAGWICILEPSLIGAATSTGEGEERG